MNRVPEMIGIILWGILFCVTLAFEEDYSKRLPRHLLRFPRYLAALGIGTPIACIWLIVEMFRASDWEEAKLFYLLLGIPLFSMLAIGGVWLVLLAVNWGMDIKEDRIVYRNIFRRTRIIYYTEITRIERRIPRNPPKKNRTPSRFERIVGKQTSFGAYRIYIGRKSITVDSTVYHYDGSAERILHAMKKQGIQCPVTIKKTRTA
jgi:hypothetical protein